MKINHRLSAVIIIEATLSNVSPLLIGSGTDESSDKEIVKRPDGKPYIPGSAFAGKFLRIFKQNQEEIRGGDISFIQFWGGEVEYVEGKEKKKQQYQSHVIFEDATLISDFLNINIRDGVKIDAKTNLAQDKGKYDYEVLEPNHEFQFRVEIKIREGFNNFDRIADFLLKQLNKFQIGASEKSGLGLIEAKNAKAYLFDFKNPDERKNWFDYVDGKFEIVKTNLAISNPIEVLKQSVFIISATFSLKSTLITATYGVDVNEPDKVQLSRKNSKNTKQYVLSGASIRGALRHRALKILKVQKNEFPEKLLNDLFGIVVDQDVRSEKKSLAQKSRLIIEEAIFSKPTLSGQTRIKIDRFTGGTITGALLESMPITRSEGQLLSLSFIIKEYKKQEAELMLFLLKDLWTSDLALGGEKNIGRGLLVGETANVYFGEEEVEITKAGISVENRAKLEKLLQS